MHIKKRHLFLFLSFSVLIWNCEQRDSTAPTQVWQKEDVQNILYTIQGLPALRVDNYYGGLFIYGHTHDDDIKVTATRRAQTDQRDHLDEMLANIKVSTRQQDDTVYVQISAPVAGRNERYLCGLNIFIPYGMPVFINYSKGSVITNELDSLVYVRGAQTRARLERHRGSADIEAVSHINMEFYSLWPHNYVTAISDSGDVNVVIPENADVSILAQSFYHPIELIDINLETYLRSYYTAEGILGSGDSPVHLKTIYGIVRIKAD